VLAVTDLGLDLATALRRLGGDGFPADLVADAEAWFAVRRLRRGELFARPGDRHSPVAIVTAGVLRLAYADVAGRDRTYAFRAEGELVCAYAANLGRGPAQFFIEAVTDATLRVIPAARFAALVREHPAWAELVHRRTEELYLAGERRQRSLLIASPAERYAEFVATQPTLATRLTRRLIASYLAIAPETLSRLGRS
jgi:CRP-like cAMP-binding protein